MNDVALPEEELLLRLRWFTRVRWLFLAGLAFAIACGAWVFQVAFPVWRTVAVGAVVLSYNVGFVAYHRWLRYRPAPALATSRVDAGLQIGLDLLALTTLVHFTGGAENPFVGFYLFHVIVGSMLFSRREAWLVALAACALFLGVVVLEYLQVVPHYHPTGLAEAAHHQHVPFLVVVCAAFILTVSSTVAITSSIVGGLRLRELQLVRTQRALLSKSADLEQAYATLTEKQQQLVQTEKHASLGQLVAGIAHELNNPIQFIHGNMTVLSEAFSDLLPIVEQHHATHPDLRIARLDYAFFRQQLPVLLSDMADGARRIAAIVRDLKTFARRDEGGLDERVDLNEAVQASMRLLHNQLKHLRVEADLDPALPIVRGNATQLQQVLVNTLQNAVEATRHALRGDGPGRIRVRTRAEDGGRRVRLSVEDNGCGIPPDVKDRIFDPFFTTKQRSGGIGLGLAITYGIVQQHEGRIVVETQVGRGTTFHYLLPVTREAAR